MIAQRQEGNRFEGTRKWVVATLAVAAIVSTAVAVGEAKVIGKNPGKIKGRWLEMDDPSVLSGYKGVYLGDVVADIQWKEARNEAPIEEDLLAEQLAEQLVEKLRQSGALGEVLDSEPAAGAAGYIRLDCLLEVEPGSRLARYAVGLGAGKSRSILEIRMLDHDSGAGLGLYHGHGIGTGMGFKIGGGGARKMTQDDNQENAKMFVKLLAEIR